MAAARKAAAAAGEKTARTFEFERNGRPSLTLELPAVLPFNAAIRAREDDTIGALIAILGSEQMLKVEAANLSIDEGIEMLNEITGVYGLDEGEAQASSTS
jgi:DNA integrity scanning protein DisA with diadenylate cyclase activity